LFPALRLLARCSADTTLLNVSYDPTREFYQQYNAAFARYWQQNPVRSRRPAIARRLGKQARTVIDGLDADVVTLALAFDIDAIADKGKLPPATGRGVCPTTAPLHVDDRVPRAQSNPKAIKDWMTWLRRACRSLRPTRRPGGAVELPGGPGIREAQIWRRRQGPRFRRAALPNVPVLDLAHGARRRRSSSAVRATSLFRGKTRRSSR
jgi:ABC-type sulfate transport system substrate-binding protein